MTKKHIFESKIHVLCLVNQVFYYLGFWIFKLDHERWNILVITKFGV